MARKKKYKIVEPLNVVPNIIYFMLVGFGEFNLHARTIEFECKMATISNALLISSSNTQAHTRTHTRTKMSLWCPFGLTHTRCLVTEIWVFHFGINDIRIDIDDDSGL